MDGVSNQAELWIGQYTEGFHCHECGAEIDYERRPGYFCNNCIEKEEE